MNFIKVSKALNSIMKIYRNVLHFTESFRFAEMLRIFLSSSL
jgi:hypothetical protein